jgi:hypothetical protein
MGKYIRIEKNTGTSTNQVWHTVLGCKKVELWDTFTVEEAETGATQRVFHIAHKATAKRGARVIYLVLPFEVARVSDSKKLVGTEVICSQC